MSAFSMLQGVVELMQVTHRNTGAPPISVSLTRNQYRQLLQEVNELKMLVAEIDDGEEPTFMGMRIDIFEDDSALPALPPIRGALQ